MTHPRVKLVAAAVAAWAVAAVVGSPANEAVAPTPPAAPPAVAVQGLAGCAARGCHGGPGLDADSGKPLPPSYHNACTNWLRYDRHANAYTVLMYDAAEERKKPFGKQKLAYRMAEILAKGSGQPVVPAYQDVRCLACHVTPALANAAPSLEVERLWREGVSCDACHTAPGKGTADWLEPHKKGWQPGGLADAYKAGLHWQGNSDSRAVVCAGCHIGAPADPKHGIPLREVNHDLIAAGHPRLNFEYATYLASMPPHWDRTSRSPTGETLPREGPVAEWLAGQTATVRVGMRLLSDQASRPDGVWPELSAFNCYACHFDFAPKAWEGDPWRKARAGERAKEKIGGPGRVPWNTANLSDPLYQLLRKDLDGSFEFRGLRVAMDRLGQKRGEVARLSNNLSTDVVFYAEFSSATGPKWADGPNAGGELVTRLNLANRALAGMDWDDAAQTYYALRAANRDRDRLAPDRPKDAADAALDAVAKLLAFPRGEVQANSPVGYDADKAADPLRAAAKAIGDWYAGRK